MHGGHVGAGADLAAGFDNWRKAFAYAAEGRRLPAADADREHRRRRQRAAPARFDALARLWDAVGEFGAGFCLDTCHAHAGGEDLLGIVDRVKAITGRIDLIHANDSKDAFDSGARPARQPRQWQDRPRADGRGDPGRRRAGGRRDAGRRRGPDQPTSPSCGGGQATDGVIVVAVVGNAAEHSTAVMVAMKNRMELSIGIAIGSSLQIALFVAPILVALSYLMGPQPMDLVFTPAEVLAIFLSVLISGLIASDGESNWLEGVLLLAVYLILGIVFFYLPDVAGVH